MGHMFNRVLANVTKKNDPWFHKIYVREHFVALSVSMITDLFGLPLFELPTKFEDEENFNMDKVFTTLS